MKTRHVPVLFGAFLVLVVVSLFVLLILEKRQSAGLAPLSEIEIGDEPGEVRFGPTGTR